MITVVARNVHRALSHGLYLLDSRGVRRDSRNGSVVMMPTRVTTEYSNPWERVVFWPTRDANPYFHLFESLWMLAGRRDLAPLVQYTKQMSTYSDDGYQVNGSAYGYRWRRYFSRDQLVIVARRLRENPDDRRSVLQMWSAIEDLDSNSKDVPCNLTATVQRDLEGRLELTVFCRSNDIVFGAYGANAVHFSVVQEYLAAMIGCPIGTYEQISVNYHIYDDWNEKLKDLPRQSYDDPYSKGLVHHIPMMIPSTHHELDIESLDAFIKTTTADAAANILYKQRPVGDPWRDMVLAVLKAHEHYRHFPAPQRFPGALDILKEYPDQKADWIVAAREWIERRADSFYAKGI